MVDNESTTATCRFVDYIHSRYHMKIREGLKGS